MALSAAEGGDPGSPAQLRRILDGPPTGRRARGPLDGATVGRAGPPGPAVRRRRADPVHVTASGVVVGSRGTILLLHRRLGRWLQPGGHIEPGESPSAAARRESEEETGLALSHPPEGPVLVRVDVHEAALGHTHLDLCYLLAGPDADPAPPPGESPHVRWYDWEEAASVADPPLAGALEARPGAWLGHHRRSRAVGPERRRGDDRRNEERRRGPAVSTEGTGQGGPRRRVGAGRRPGAEDPGGPLEQLIRVQDLDISIAQLEHRRASLAERRDLEALGQRWPPSTAPPESSGPSARPWSTARRRSRPRSPSSPPGARPSRTACTPTGARPPGTSRPWSPRCAT